MGYLEPRAGEGAAGDSRSDLFSLGCVLYEMLAGRRAFLADSAGETLSVDPGATSRRRSTGGHPGVSAAVVERCLEKRPGDRFDSAKDLAVALESLYTGARLPAPTEVFTARGLRRALRPRSRRVALAAALAALAGLGLWRWTVARNPPIRSLAVLPFADQSAQPGEEYLASGLTEELITQLAQLSELRVTSKTSSEALRGSRDPLPVLAQRLGVQAVVQGSIARQGSRIRVSAQLVHGPTDRHLWAGRYEREEKDLFSLAERDRARHRARDRCQPHAARGAPPGVASAGRSRGLPRIPPGHLSPRAAQRRWPHEGHSATIGRRSRSRPSMPPPTRARPRLQQHGDARDLRLPTTPIRGRSRPCSEPCSWTRSWRRPMPSLSSVLANQWRWSEAEAASRRAQDLASRQRLSSWPLLGGSGPPRGGLAGRPAGAQAGPALPRRRTACRLAALPPARLPGRDRAMPADAGHRSRNAGVAAVAGRRASHGGARRGGGRGLRTLGAAVGLRRKRCRRSGRASPRTGCPGVAIPAPPRRARRGGDGCDLALPARRPARPAGRERRRLSVARRGPGRALAPLPSTWAPIPPSTTCAAIRGSPPTCGA